MRGDLYLPLQKGGGGQFTGGGGGYLPGGSLPTSGLYIIFHNAMSFAAELIQ